MESVLKNLRPAVVIADSGVCEGIFTSYASALDWARQHGMNVSNVRGDVPFVDVQWPQYFKPIESFAPIVATFTDEQRADIAKMDRLEQGILNVSLDILRGPAQAKRNFPEGESRQEFENDRMGQTGYDNAQKMFGKKEKS
jgi:hypothetical protein